MQSKGNPIQARYSGVRIPHTLWIGMLVLLVGCGRVGRLDEKERNNRLVARAYELLDAGQHSDAAVRLQEALDVYPLMARPHLDLALILHEHRQDFVRAIYHYRRYLELRPDTDKANMIEGRIRQAALSFAERVWREMPSPPALEEGDRVGEGAATADVDTLRTEWEKLRAERDRLLVDLVRRQEALEQAEALVERLEASVRAERAQSQQLRTERDLARTSSTREEQVRIPARGQPETAVPRTYTVRPNDSLSVIAHRVYGDATQWRKIQDANREVLGDSVALRIGQVLVIP